MVFSGTGRVTGAFVVLTATLIGLAQPAAAADDKTAELAAMAARKRATDPVTLTNGTGDGRLTIKVDGYGSFGSTTPAGDVSFDPVGSIEASGAVWESAVLFSPTKQFLSTSGMHVGTALPPVEITKLSDKVATSAFTIGKYAFTLRQEVKAAAGNGTSFVQTYKITNNNTTARSVYLSRYVEGDLYFVGSFGNDFGGVSADKNTVYQFDTGDDPSAPTTFVGITSSGGTRAGFAVQRYRFTDPVVAIGRIPAAIKNQIAGDDDGDGVTDSGYDVGIIQQNNFTIPAGGTITYTTTTRFGSGSINSQVSKVAGCITLNGNPAAGRTVKAVQTGVATQTTTTDAAGCYEFDSLTNGKAADIIIKLPTIKN